jgi:hypothetical protein
MLVTAALANKGFSLCLEHAVGDMDPARELPIRARSLFCCIRDRTDGSTRLRGNVQKTTCVLQGRPQTGNRQLALGFRPKGRRCESEILIHEDESVPFGEVIQLSET